MFDINFKTYTSNQRNTVKGVEPTCPATWLHHQNGPIYVTLWNVNLCNNIFRSVLPSIIKGCLFQYKGKRFHVWARSYLIGLRPSLYKKEEVTWLRRTCEIVNSRSKLNSEFYNVWWGKWKWFSLMLKFIHKLDHKLCYNYTNLSFIQKNWPEPNLNKPSIIH